MWRRNVPALSSKMNQRNLSWNTPQCHIRMDTMRSLNIDPIYCHSTMPSLDHTGCLILPSLCLCLCLSPLSPRIGGELVLPLKHASCPSNFGNRNLLEWCSKLCVDAKWFQRFATKFVRNRIAIIITKYRYTCIHTHTLYIYIYLLSNCLRLI